ncbi:MAG TPA: DUF6491 family protein [Allosphingosinicella sp.]|jgi:hypothetical protein|nr:DUF6491 family protein [Allosphingosinicella sp.]
MKKMILTFAVASVLAAPLSAAPAPETAAAVTREEVRIPFVNFGAIRSFHANDDEVVYLQDRRDRWYRAEVIGGCRGLPWAHRLGVDTRGSSSFDRFSTLIVDGERCQLTSLTRSGEPERRPWKKKLPRS